MVMTGMSRGLLSPPLPLLACVSVPLLLAALAVQLTLPGLAYVVVVVVVDGGGGGGGGGGGMTVKVESRKKTPRGAVQ